MKDHLLALVPSSNTCRPQPVAAEQPFTYQPRPVADTAIPRRGATDPLVLSFAQQRLWFIQQLAPDGTFYTLPTALRLHGVLNRSALQTALTHLIERQATLRTRFPAVHGVPIPELCDPSALVLSQIDLSTYPAAEREVQLRQQVQAALLQPFQLDQEIPLRVQLYRLAEQEHLLLFVLHHIAIDRWFSPILRQEFSHFYQAACRGENPSLPPLAIQYTDFALWQQRSYQEGKWQTQLDYWKTQLSGELPILELLGDRPRLLPQSVVETRPGGKVTLVLSPTLTTELKSLARQTKTTLFMTVLAAFNILLYRYSGQDDIIIGTPMTNRDRVEVEGLMGFFANTLPIRSDLRGNPTVRELLARVRSLTLNAYANRDLPFEKMVEAIRPVRDLDRQTIFQVMLVFGESDSTAYQLAELQIAEEPIEKGIAEFDLMLDLVGKPTGLQATLHYRLDLFDGTTMERMLTHFQEIIAAMVATPDQTIAQLPLLTEAEREQQLQVWNQTQVVHEQPLLLHRLIEKQCQARPQHTALLYREQQVTYGELNQQANQLARFLIRKGVQAETLVAICLPRSPQIVATMLAVLKAGGAFLLLDPTWPAERRAQIYRQSKVTFLLTDAAAEHADFTWDALEQLDLQQERAAWQGEASHDLTVAVAPEQLAYVVYTSGSTGEPKGVMCTHQAMANYVMFYARMIALTPQDRRLQFGSVGSEHFIAEVINTLCNGAGLFFRPQETPTITEFLQLLTDHHLTTTSLPVAYWQQWVQTLAAGTGTIPPSLRVVVTGMEQVPSDAFRIWQQAIGNRLAWFNVYGPVETTCVSTTYKADFSDDQLPSRIPIGRPIDNVCNYILDQQMQPVPIGVAGELYIGGMGLARGYLNQPALTSEKFVANPFGPGRLYRTGDFARYLPSGDIVFLGRRDHQVKLRGYRVELGEIEASLAEHPALTQAAVLADTSEAGAKGLIAYVVAEPAQTSPTPQSLRQYLATKLPSYMIPAAFIIIETMPLTPSGKVDRQTLAKTYPAASLATRAGEENIVPPRTELEVALAQLWSQLLGIEQVGIESNFFELGGHSLLAVRLLAEIERQFDAKPTLSAFFVEPTIAYLARALAPTHAVQPDKLGAAFNTLSPRQQEAVKQLNVALADPAGPQRWRTLAQRNHWHRRRRLLHGLAQALPYSLTHQSLAWLCRSAPWRQRVYPKQLSLTQAFLTQLATVADTPWRPDDEAILSKSLFYNTVQQYHIRQHGSQQAAEAAIVGLERLAAAQAKAQGVVLVQHHHTANASLRLPEGSPTATVGGIHHYLAYFQIQNETLQNSLYANQLHTARQILQAGGRVRIAPDGHYGASTAQTYAFLGRRRPFFSSFAELALMTNALVMPVAVSTNHAGCTQFHFIAPLDAGEPTTPHAQRVEKIVAQYVAFLRQQWIEAPWLVPWHQMERHLTYPLLQ
ncbi:MAG: amino acid adenylation domain-containing protein [Caldilineaceae bacterium]|nr:amino acid adenylation domain-containing protein [Caldilineaceae bacterium]